MCDVYAASKEGMLFANLLGPYVHYRTDASNTVDRWSNSSGGKGCGVDGEICARLGSVSLFAEPLVSLSWQKTDLGTLSALGQSLDFDNGAGVTGKLGLRITDCSTWPPGWA